MKFNYILLVLFVIILMCALYVNTTKEGNSENIVISLTTSPNRISKIEQVLDRIMNQTVVPSAIVLNLPFVFKRTSEKFGEIPQFIASNPIIKINRCEDIGPSTKVLPTSELFTDPETIIISIDDDTLYKETMIETLLHYHRLFPETVITGLDHFLKIDTPSNIDTSKIPQNMHFSEFIEGYSGVLYTKDILDKINISKEYIESIPNYCFQADDFIISNYLVKHKIPIFTVGLDKTIETQLEYGYGTDALHAGANGTNSGNQDNYEKCTSYMQSISDYHFVNIV